ncbi:unnamed protein product [Larinioides sclopetarius]|uniref:Uncharacterized protein n=1 Tax=Larinioides sclopetarius TaxID=280406 RepID=A0AAV2BBI2_9ARAC
MKCRLRVLVHAWNERRGYTVRPSSLPLEASSSEGATEDHGSASHFHALRVPVKFDTDGISSPNYSPPRRQENNFSIDDTPHIHIHRVTCNVSGFHCEASMLKVVVNPSLLV